MIFKEIKRGRFGGSDMVFWMIRSKGKLSSDDEYRYGIFGRPG